MRIVIEGAPRTGKTTVAQILMRALQQLGAEVYITQPTPDFWYTRHKTNLTGKRIQFQIIDTKEGC